MNVYVTLLAAYCIFQIIFSPVGTAPLQHAGKGKPGNYIRASLVNSSGLAGHVGWNVSNKNQTDHIAYHPPVGGPVTWLVFSLYGSIVVSFLICMMQQLIRKYKKCLRRNMIISTVGNTKNCIRRLSRGSGLTNSAFSDLSPLLNNESLDTII